MQAQNGRGARLHSLGHSSTAPRPQAGCCGVAPALGSPCLHPGPPPRRPHSTSRVFRHHVAAGTRVAGHGLAWHIQEPNLPGRPSYPPNSHILLPSHCTECPDNPAHSPSYPQSSEPAVRVGGSAGDISTSYLEPHTVHGCGVPPGGHWLPPPHRAQRPQDSSQHKPGSGRKHQAPSHCF